MPDPEVAYLHQKAVLWLFRRYDRYGQVEVYDPIEVTVRWIDHTMVPQTADSENVTLDATVITDREIPVGSHMWKGELEDWYGTGAEPDDSRLMQVKTYNETPDLKGRVVRRKVGLIKLRNNANSV